MKHAFLILTHHSPEHIYTQVKRMEYEGNLFFIHIDKKRQIDVADEYWQKLQSMPHVTILKDRVNVQWGSIRIVDATLNVMKEALKHDVGYLHLLSGECLHVKSMSYFHRYFEKHAGTEFMSNMVMPEKNTLGWGANRYDKYHFHEYFNPRSQKFRDKAIKFLNAVGRVAQRNLKKIGINRKYGKQHPPVHGGIAWWSLTKDCCNYIMQYLKEHPAYYPRFRFTQLPDEMFFQTIVMNSPFKDKVVDNCLRYTHFNIAVTRTHATGIGIENLDNIKGDDILIARKFTDASKEMIAYLERNVYNEDRAAKG